MATINKRWAGRVEEEEGPNFGKRTKAAGSDPGGLFLVAVEGDDGWEGKGEFTDLEEARKIGAKVAQGRSEGTAAVWIAGEFPKDPPGPLLRLDATKGTPRWTLRVFMGRHPRTGKRRFVVETFDRMGDARDRAAELEAQKAGGTRTVPSRMTLGEYLDTWLDAKAGQVRERTITGYRGIIRRYVQEPEEGSPLLAPMRLRALTPEAFEALYQFLRDERGLTPRTIRYLHTILRQALGDAVKRKALAANPTDHAKVPKRGKDTGGTKAGKRKFRAMTEEQAARFLEVARGDRYFPLWVLLLMGGIRPGEALGLKWGDVDLEADRIHLRRSLNREGVDGWRLDDLKTDKARRVVVLPPVAVQALRAWKAAQAEERLKLGAEYQTHGFVFATEFGAPLDNANLGRRNFLRILEAANREGDAPFGTWQVFQRGRWIPEAEKDPEAPHGRRRFRPAFRIYDLRHTCATLLLKRGVNPKIVQERLGHASITLTLDTYSHVLPDMQEGAADEFQAMFGAGG